MANPFPRQNSLNRLDVNRDGLVAPNDVLLVINDLNARGSRRLEVPPRLPLAPPPFIDVSGDNMVAPGNALSIINFLNGSGAQGETQIMPDEYRGVWWHRARYASDSNERARRFWDDFWWPSN